MKVKFKCELCGKEYYDYIPTNNRRKAAKYKRLFKDSNSIIHRIQGKCKPNIIDFDNTSSIYPSTNDCY